MANESSKSRLHFNDFEKSILRGTVLDIGAGGDPVVPHAKSFDVEDGDANHISDYVKEQYDCVYSSHCLEHMDSPYQAIRAWFELVKPGGYLFVIVPDEDLYEQGLFPSIFNGDHKFTFTISKKKSWSESSVNVFELICSLPGAELLSLKLNDVFYNRSRSIFGNAKTPDQTEGSALAQIEFIVRKVDNDNLSCAGVKINFNDTCSISERIRLVSENQKLKRDSAQNQSKLLWNMACVNEVPYFWKIFWLVKVFKVFVGFLAHPFALPNLLKNIAKVLVILLKNRKNVHFISMYECLGDIVACEPIIRYVASRNIGKKIVIATSKEYRDIFLYNPVVSKVLALDSFFEWIVIRRLLRELKITCTNIYLDGKKCRKFGIMDRNENALGINWLNYYNYGGILKLFAQAEGMPPLEDAPEFWLNPSEEMTLPYNKYVVLHCKASEKSRNWKDKKWQETVYYLTSKGYDVVEIGKESTLRINNQKYHNVCGKYSLQQYAWIIKKAEMFVGIDSSFAHFANALGTPGVILLGKLLEFDRYNPYSGEYGQEKNAVFVRSDFPAEEICVEFVLNAVVKCLKMVSNK